MIALTSKLVGPGLPDLAPTELQVVKRSLERTAPAPPAKKADASRQTAKRPLSSLLHLDLPVGYLLEDDAVAVAVTYYQCVLKILSIDARPRDIERLPEYLLLEDNTGCVALIIRQAKQGKRVAKAVKQLQSIAGTLLALCPSVASSADESSMDSRLVPSPAAVLKIQTLALRIRCVSSTLTNQPGDLSKTLVLPLLKCMTACARRCHDAVNLTQVVEKSFADITSNLGGIAGESLYNIHSLLYEQAQQAGLFSRALHWAEAMVRDCEGFEVHHARSLAAEVRRTVQAQLQPDIVDDAISRLSALLSHKPTGSRSDYDILVNSLAELSRILLRERRNAPYAQQLSALAAGFAQRYARSYPDHNARHLMRIIEAALRCSKSSDDVLSWITTDAAAVFIQAGVLRTVARNAETRPLAEAWTVDAAAVSLSRILRALLLRSVRRDGETNDLPGVEEPDVAPAERGAMLEWELKYVLELAPRTKYQLALQKLVPTLVQSLSEVYSYAQYPLRRARVAFFVVTLREHDATLVPIEVLRGWRDNAHVEPLELANDVGLERYREDIVARTTVARLFSDGAPAFDSIKPALTVWQRIVSECKNTKALQDQIDDLETLVLQLHSIATYLAMLGEDPAAVVIWRLIANLQRPGGGESSASLNPLLDLAKQYLRLGDSEKAGSVLVEAESIAKHAGNVNFQTLRCQIAHAGHYQRTGNTTKCAGVLENARLSRDQLPPSNVPREESRAYDQLHAEAWLVRSRHCLAVGSPHEALAAAKQSVSVLNGMWSALERQGDSANSPPAFNLDAVCETSITGLSKGISKLDLTSSNNTGGKDTASNRRGAAFWPLVPLLCESLQHLSDMYAHHGLYTEANYFSERAIIIAQSVGSTILLSRIRSHRNRLLVLANRLEEAELCLAQDEVLPGSRASGDGSSQITANALSSYSARYESLLEPVFARLSSDVTLNILTESTLSAPALVRVGQVKNPSTSRGRKQPNPPSSAANSKKGVRKVGKHDAQTEEGVEYLLKASRDCLMTSQSSNYYTSSTVQTHSDCSSLSNVTLLHSAVSKTHDETLQPLRQALHIDLPRLKALRYEQTVVGVDNAADGRWQPRDWPSQSVNPPPSVLTAQSFQEDYINIIPPSWTVVSLCLSDNSNDLYIARYRSKETPLVLKLPFSGHKPDGDHDEAFGFHQGRTELQEIVELSNYTCHNPGMLDSKGAKSKWWSEREALDRRLHELLINIENMWFGGFKGVFSQLPAQTDLLAVFRRAFDQILANHLPSRRPKKNKVQTEPVHDKILELFVGLGPEDAATDLEEPIADLLYFVVDMLQFSGERNAYDEVDFDSMAVDVLDALRTYHEASNAGHEGSQHLVLVLDRRLQAFPWESMPCLQEASVSRVGSMLSLRQSLLAMRAKRESLTSKGSANGTGDCHKVQKTSGTFILNPSSDLTATQAMLQPALSSLTEGEGSSWKSMTNEPPSEEAFKSALIKSSILLYFGHGAGSQYIRPRTIKRLHRCAEVVWLIGCSSGAVEEHGGLEPSAVPLSYLLAGGIEFKDHTKDPSRCMAVVATLWDVTDKDIDRFSLAVGEDWGLWPESEQHKLPTKTPSKRRIVAAPCTPDQVPKTPKTPRARKTPAPPKTPAKGRSRPKKKEGESFSLVEAVSRSREVCYLRYLNGAAPVVYGVPVYLGD